MPVPQVYEELLRKQQVEISPFPLDGEQGFKIDEEEFKEYWSRTEAALILTPHNPTGTLFPEALLADLIRVSSELRKPLIIDETLKDFDETVRDFTGNQHKLHQKPRGQVRQVVEADCAILLRSFSSYHALAGLRLGYAIGHPTLLAQLQQLMEPWPLNSIALPAALASTKDKGFRRRTSEFYEAETVYALNKLERQSRVKPQRTPWGLFMQIQPAIPGLKELFSSRGILIDEYSDAKEGQYLSFPFRSHPENARFFRVLQRILREQRQS
jgi:threonine-phosphate decarboxylase